MREQTPTEELLNSITHGIAVILSVLGLIVLLHRALLSGNNWYIASAAIYGTTMVILYLASTLFHGTRHPLKKQKFRIFDHAAIYLLISGTYTPFCLITLRENWGWLMFFIIWGLSAVGIFLKVYRSEKYQNASLAVYLLMGWALIIVIKPFIQGICPQGLFWVFAGGFFYTTGTIFYKLTHIRFTHVIWHFFVMFGSFSEGRQAFLEKRPARFNVNEPREE